MSIIDSVLEGTAAQQDMVKGFLNSRLQAGNPDLSEQSARILLERGTRQVEGGKPRCFSDFCHPLCSFSALISSSFSCTGLVFSRDFRINLVCADSGCCKFQ